MQEPDRIPETLLDAAQICDDAAINASLEQVENQPAPMTRQDWEAQFRHMAANADDVLLDGSFSYLSSWDDEEWEWLS